MTRVSMSQTGGAVAIFVDGAGRIGATGISADRIVVSGDHDPDGDDGRDVTFHLETIGLKDSSDTCPSGNSSVGSNTESSEHKKGETAGNSSVVGRLVGISGTIGTSIGIVPKRITHETTDPTLSSDTSEEIAISGDAILNTSKTVRGGRTRQYEVLFRWRLDQSERDTWHCRVSVRGQACMDSCQSLAIMRRLVECKKSIIPLDPAISLDEDLKGRNCPSHLEAINGARIICIWVLEFGVLDFRVRI
ncbi:hypothetical protein Tco_0537792 [Tanacetum coccineum]